MKYSGLYLIPNPTTALDTAIALVSTLVQNLETTYPTATRHSPWTLSYRVFRDTIPRDHTPSADADGKARPFPHTYQSILHHSTYSPSRAYICTQPPGDPGRGTVAAIPLRQQDAYAALVRYQEAALWAPRHVLSVTGGTTYTVGLFTIQIAELRATREGPQSAAVQSPGVVVSISVEIGGGEDADESAANGHAGGGSLGNGVEDAEDEALQVEYAQAIIREAWGKVKEGKDLGRSEIKEVMMKLGRETDTKETDAAVRMWCEVLRLRG